MAFVLTALSGLNSMFGIINIGIDASLSNARYVNGHLESCQWTSPSALLLGAAGLLCCLIHYFRVSRNPSVPAEHKHGKKLIVTVIFSLYVVAYGFGAVGKGPCAEFADTPPAPSLPTF
ncbi:MAG TPA: hypothetical protein VEF06_07355 [Bryobacteraceae bacterium]|nr:hypothetical protein [Bryobacteraceae bacterium]